MCDAGFFKKHSVQVQGGGIRVTSLIFFATFSLWFFPLSWKSMLCEKGRHIPKLEKNKLYNYV